MTSKSLIIALAVIVATTLAPQAGAQGSLTPPGAPGPTMKSLQEIYDKIVENNDALANLSTDPRTPIDSSQLPLTISAPGSYVATENLVSGSIAQSAITINSPNVTIDFNGFSLSGPGRTAGSFINGVFVQSGASRHANIVVRNGTVASFSGAGVNVSRSSGARVSEISARDCAQAGILVGRGTTVIRCNAHNNGDGIGAQRLDPGQSADPRKDEGALILHSNAYNNSNSGFYLDTNGTIMQCVARANNEHGFTFGLGSTVSNCSSRANGEEGYRFGDGCVLTNCAAHNNGQSGFFGRDRNIIRECVSVGNLEYGMSLIQSNTIEHNSISENSLDGIFLDDPDNFNNNADFNRVLENICNRNGLNGTGVGIYVDGTDNRIEGNVLMNNDRGVELDQAGNFVVKNSAGESVFTGGIPTRSYHFNGLIQTYGEIQTFNGGQFDTDVGPWANWEFEGNI